MLRGPTITKGALLVAGTTIGGGMLAMPVFTSLGGFIPSLVLFFVCWLFMVGTGLLFLEACLWIEEDTNMVSMAGLTLGTFGKTLAWSLYIFLFYALTLAYVVGCGRLTALLFSNWFPEWSGVLFFLVFFGPMVWAGARLIGRVNVVLMGGLILSYLGFVVIGYKFVQFDKLIDRNWLLSLKALPVAFTAFGFQGLIPTLTRYLGRDVHKIRSSIFIGSFAALVTYVIWHWLILGIVPKEGEGGLLEALENGYTAVQPLKLATNNAWIYVIGEFFAFFALVTSFLGVSLGLRDFLADGLKIEKTEKGRLLLCLLIFIPVLIAALLYPGIFLEALGFAGGFGCALLLGLLPILMAWSGRYHMKLSGQPQLPGGKALLVLMGLFVVLEVTVETLHLLHLF